MTEKIPGPWLNHDNRPLPADIKDEQQVEVVFRNGETATGTVGQYHWETDNRDWQIIEYRLLG